MVSNMCISTYVHKFYAYIFLCFYILILYVTISKNTLGTTYTCTRNLNACMRLLRIIIVLIMMEITVILKTDDLCFTESLFKGEQYYLVFFKRAAFLVCRCRLKNWHALPLHARAITVENAGSRSTKVN